MQVEGAEKRVETEKGAEGQRSSLFFRTNPSARAEYLRESPVLVAPLIMDGPQACSRWAQQLQSQLRHFKKPSVGPLPSPSSHSGRSEAPENSEMSPREKGNQGLPVLLTDGSTHLEQIAGSDWATLSQRTAICGVQSGAQRFKDTQDVSVRLGGQRSLVQMNCSAQHRGVACHSAELQLCSTVLQHLELSGAEEGIFSCALFFRAYGARGNTDVSAGGFNRNKNKKTSSYIQLQPTCVGAWKEMCKENIQEVAF